METIAYGYNDSQWGDLLTSYDGNTITYDAMGNPTSYLGKTLAWEGKKLVAYTDGGNTISYAYNEDGLRLEKTVNGVNTEYYYNGSILIAMADGTNTQKFSYDSTGNVVSVNFNGTEYYYLRNAQGDIVKMIDSSGNTVVEYLYDSWGKLIATTGSLANTVGANQPFRYRGYVYDQETGWYYLQSRYYDPTTCRFISADVLLSTGQGVIGHNSFAYCLNNPIKMYDSNGRFGLLATLLIGAVVGAVVNVVSNGLCNLAEDKDFFDGAGLSVLEGAASGLLAASPIGLVGQIIGNAVISGSSSMIRQYSESGRINAIETGVDAGIGALSGFIGGEGARYGKKTASMIVNVTTKTAADISYVTPKVVINRVAGRTLVKSLRRVFKVITPIKYFKGIAKSLLK